MSSRSNSQPLQGGGEAEQPPLFFAPLVLALAFTGSVFFSYSLADFLHRTLWVDLCAVSAQKARVDFF